MKFVFNKNISGSNNGIDIVDYKEGQIIEEQDISKKLLDAWKEREVISPLEDEEDGEVDVDNSGDDVDNSENSGEAEVETSNTGDQQTDDFLNGKTDVVPEGTKELTEEEALVLEAKAIFQKVDEEHPLETDRLKEIGIALGIANMNKTVNPEKIEEKMKKYLEELAEKENEAE